MKRQWFGYGVRSVSRHSLGVMLGLAVVAVVIGANVVRGSGGSLGAASPGVSRSASGAGSNAAATLQPERIKRGRYLVSIAGCNDCHTPWKMGSNGPEPDMSRMLSGHPASVPVSAPPTGSADSSWVWHGTMTNTAFAGPWGITYAPNLTPHPVSGILAVWDEDRFLKAIRTGKHFGESRPIMPPMPWSVYRNMTDEDLKSVFAYLRSIPAVHNEVPDWQPPAAKPPSTPTALRK